MVENKNKTEEFKKILETKDTFRRLTAPQRLPAPLIVPDFKEYRRQTPAHIMDKTLVRNINKYYSMNKNKAASNELRGLCGWLADTFTNNVEARDFIRYLMTAGIRTREGSGDLRQQVQGLLAEFSVSSLFNTLETQPKILWLKQQGWDRGEDVNYNGKAYDVKCIVRKSRWQEKWSELNLHPYQYQHLEENITDYLVLTSFSYITKTIEVINVIPYQDLKQVLTFYRQGEVRNDSGETIKDDVWMLDYEKIEKYEKEREEQRRKQEEEERKKRELEERRKREREDISWIFDKSPIGTDFETMETAGLPF